MLKAKHKDLMLKPEWIYKKATFLFLGDPYIPIIWSTRDPILIVCLSPHISLKLVGLTSPPGSRTIYEWPRSTRRSLQQQKSVYELSIKKFLQNRLLGIRCICFRLARKHLGRR